MASEEHSGKIPPEEIEGSGGFEVEFSDPERLYQNLTQGVSGEIGSIILESPVEGVTVEVQSDKETFELSAEISYQFDSHLGFEMIDTLSREIDLPFRERGGYLIVAGRLGREFVIGRGSMLDETRISTHTAVDVIETKTIIDAPLLNPETFEATRKDLAELIKTVVASAYKQKQKPAPSETLIIDSKIKPNRHRRYEIARGGEVVSGLEVEKPSITFEEIGGHIEAKREIQSLAFALKNPELYKKWGTKPPKGILVYGPPGTGKTLMAKALAAEAEARFFHVQAADIGSKWYGESEKILQLIFDRANQEGEKTILFFDEIDSIAPPRNSAHEATQKVIATMLENMDGITEQQNVMVVASTNRIKEIEPALVRAGRFDRWVEVPLPDTEDRKAILKVHVGKANQIAGESLFEVVDIDRIAEKTDSFSGADMAEIIRRTLEEKVRQEGTGSKPEVVTTDDILFEIEKYERVKETRDRQIGFG